MVNCSLQTLICNTSVIQTTNIDPAKYVLKDHFPVGDASTLIQIFTEIFNLHSANEKHFNIPLDTFFSVHKINT